MKFLLLSDLHLMASQPIGRKDNIRKAQMDKLSFVLTYARDNQCTILQAGDFFDSPRSWYLLPEVLSMLKEHGEPIYCVYGQHDTYMYSSKRAYTSLGVLETAGVVQILGKALRMGSVTIYGASYGEELPEFFDFGLKGIEILVLHAPIGERGLWSTQVYQPAGDFLLRHERYDLILCGDIHRSFKISDGDRNIVNTGPMLRKTAEEYSFDHKPHFFVYDTDGKLLNKVDIPHKPAEEVLSRKHIDEMASVDISELTEALANPEKFGVRYVDNLYKLAKDSGKENLIGKLEEIMMESENG